jgi:hypothetical protein
MKELSFPGAFERRDKFLYFGLFFCEEFERYVNGHLSP